MKKISLTLIALLLSTAVLANAQNNVTIIVDPARHEKTRMMLENNKNCQEYTKKKNNSGAHWFFYGFMTGGVVVYTGCLLLYVFGMKRK